MRLGLSLGGNPEDSLSLRPPSVGGRANSLCLLRGPGGAAGAGGFRLAILDPPKL